MTRQWNPDCQGPCDCPGEERAEPEQLELPLCPMAPYEAQLPDLVITIELTIPSFPAQVLCGAHELVQHRDRKRPWCNHCGRAADGELIGRPRAA